MMYNLIIIIVKLYLVYFNLEELTKNKYFNTKVFFFNYLYKG